MEQMRRGWITHVQQSTFSQPQRDDLAEKGGRNRNMINFHRKTNDEKEKTKKNEGKKRIATQLADQTGSHPVHPGAVKDYLNELKSVSIIQRTDKQPGGELRLKPRWESVLTGNVGSGLTDRGNIWGLSIFPFRSIQPNPPPRPATVSQRVSNRSF